MAKVRSPITTYSPPERPLHTPLNSPMATLLDKVTIINHSSNPNMVVSIPIVAQTGRAPMPKILLSKVNRKTGVQECNSTHLVPYSLHT